MSIFTRRRVFAAAGALGVTRGAIGLAHPTYWQPTTTLDWAAVLTFSGFLAAVAAAMLLLTCDQQGASRWIIGVGAAGAGLAGAANALEDGVGVSELGYAFAAGTALMATGLLLGGLLLSVFARSRRWVGLLFLADVAALAVDFDSTGLVVFGSTWLVLAAACRYSQPHAGRLPLRVRPRAASSQDTA
jgi:hypothetical protein